MSDYYSNIFSQYLNVIERVTKNILTQNILMSTESQSSLSTPSKSKQNHSDHEQSMPPASQVVTTRVEPAAPEKRNVSGLLTIDKERPVRKLSQSKFMNRLIFVLL